MTNTDAIIDHATALRHQIHQYPELGYKEKQTAAVVRAELDRLGIPWVACTETGTLGHLAVNASGEHIALRADMDALPVQEETGVSYASQRDNHMHACGHDGHTASLLAAAAVLKEKENTLPGPVTLLFQPAEEGGHGAKAMIEAGALDGIDVIYGYHNWPTLPIGQAMCPDGPFMAANGYFTVTVSGSGGHASQPENCIDPVLIAANIIVQVQQIVSRSIAPQEAGVVSICQMDAGSASNVIPDEAVIKGTIRAQTSAQRTKMAESLNRIVQSCCGVAHAQGVCDFTPCYPATVNHAQPARYARTVLQNILSTDCIVSEGLPVMGSEDFSYYLECIPGTYIMIGSDEGKSIPLHNARFDYNDKLIPIAVQLWEAIATGAYQDQLS